MLRPELPFVLWGYVHLRNARKIIMSDSTWTSIKHGVRDQDPGCAKCEPCSKAFSILNMGEAALASHAKGSKHQAAASCKSALNPHNRHFSPVTSVTPPGSCRQCKRQWICLIISHVYTVMSESVWSWKSNVCMYVCMYERTLCNTYVTHVTPKKAVIICICLFIHHSLKTVNVFGTRNLYLYEIIHFSLLSITIWVSYFCSRFLPVKVFLCGSHPRCCSRRFKPWDHSSCCWRQPI